MALSEQSTIDLITINEDGCISYRTANRILKDGQKVSETHHITSIDPGHELEGHPAKVIAVANLFWTDEVIAAFEAKVAANKPQR
jgi:hypothetical protein